MLKFEVYVFPTKDTWDAHVDTGEIDGVGAYSLGSFMAHSNLQAQATAVAELERDGLDYYIVDAVERW